MKISPPFVFNPFTPCIQVLQLQLAFPGPQRGEVGGGGGGEWGVGWADPQQL